MGRTGRAASWLLLSVAASGLTLRLVYASRPGVPGADEAGALLLAVAPAAVLAAVWGLAVARAWRQDRADRRDARRATLLRHADPVLAQVAGHESRLASHDSALAEIMAAMEQVCKARGITLDGDTKPMPALFLVPGDRDSA